MLKGSLRRWSALAGSALILGLYGVALAQTAAQDGRSFATGRGTPPRTPVVQGQVIAGVSRSDSVFRVLGIDASGYLQVKEQSPASSFLYDRPSIISTSLIAGNADSSAAYPMIGANHIYLYFTFTDTIVTQCSLWAVQVRRHMGTAVDSLSTFPILLTPSLSAPTNSGTGFLRNTVVDTLGSTNGPVSVVALANETVWPMEYLIAWPYGMKSPRRTFSMEVVDRNGLPITGTYISVRVRLLAVYKNTAGTIAARSIVRVDMQGTR